MSVLNPATALDERPSPAADHPDTADSPETPDRPPSDDLLLRVPQQHRSRRTLESFMAAARHLLGEGGESAVTVSDVARRAKVSVGAFYTRFEGRDDLIRYLGERSFEEAIAEWEAEIDREVTGLDPALSHLAAAFLAEPLRTVVRLDGYQDPAPSRLRRFEDRVARDLRVFDPFPSPPREDDLLRARFLVGGLRELARRAEQDESEVETTVPADPDRLARIAASMLTGAISSEDRDDAEVTPPPDPEGPGDGKAQAAEADVDLFDVWG